MRLGSTCFGVAAVVLAGLVRADDRAGFRPAPPLGAAGSAAASLAALEREERTLRAEFESLATKEEAARHRMILRGRSMYRVVRLGLLPVGSGFGALLDHAIKMERARRALDQDTGEFRRAGVRRVEILALLQGLSAKRAPLEMEREAANKAQLLADEAEDRKRSFDRAFETSTGVGDYVAIYGAGIGSPAGPQGPSGSTEGFRGMKGRLPFPIAGRAEIRNVRKPGAPGPGLEMSAPSGTPVRAVHAGRVAFADRYDPFGQIVILDHGDHYYTLMGYLGSTDVRVGDDLSAGAKIGTVGMALPDEGATERTQHRGPALYFEVRHGSTTVEPSPWLGL
ncbi:MAG TPA: peptidoglycan DD-metalloendopeptidase family protein [Polyangiaceae bacterium]|nr:peptidoglycan DD-metalloendopeptidase family protein [Polyangiaceae bacterium]